MRPASAALLLALALVIPGVPAVSATEVPLNGVAIGASLRELVRTLGHPQSVISGDSGNRFDFADGTAIYADDDGIVLAVELQAGSPRIEIDGTPRTFPIAVYSAARADAELADVAEFATPTLRSYRLAPRRDLVLAFAQSSRRLERVVYGEPGQLARLGLLPGDAAAKAVAYRAPRLRNSTPPAAPSGPQATVYRIEIDRRGAVTSVDVAVAAEPNGDARIADQLRGNRYAPATLDGRPIAATIFVEPHR